MMKWASALSTRVSLEAAVKEVTERASLQLQDQPDLGFVFISSAFASEFSRLMPLIQEQLSIPALVGCSGGGVVGVNSSGKAQEVEQTAALCLTLAKLPDVQVHTFHRSMDDLPDLDESPDAWIEFIGVSPQSNPQFVLMADPMSQGINELLQGLDFAYPGAPKVGGLSVSPSFNRAGSLFCNGQHYQEGLVGVALSGNIVLETIVAQGCRPIGSPFRVVEGDRNIILKLESQLTGDVEFNEASQPPLEILQQMLREELAEEDRDLLQRALFIGVAQNEFKLRLQPGDFLIRNVLGIDPRNGAMAIGDRVRPGQRVQFHLRDARASAQDLTTLLQTYQTAHSDTAAPLGALMFACLGRGEGLYEEPNFDSRLVNQYLAQLPISGFFCNGEIGPVAGTTFLHGYTSVFGICRPL
jgi:small ligand-binding sensory domain FIST